MVHKNGMVFKIVSRCFSIVVTIYKKLKRIANKVAHRLNATNVRNFASLNNKLDMLLSFLILKELSPSIFRGAMPDLEQLGILNGETDQAKNHILNYSALPEYYRISTLGYRHMANISNALLMTSQENMNKAIELARMATLKGHMNADAFNGLFFMLPYYSSAQHYKDFLLEMSLEFLTRNDTLALIQTARPHALNSAGIAVNILLANGLEEQTLAAIYRIRALGINDFPAHAPMVASFALAQRIHTPQIESSAILYKAFEKSFQQNSLGNLFAGKRVALVCKGAYELGKGNGGAIDQHDIICRVNINQNYKEYAADYGSRTDVSFSRALGSINEYKFDIRLKAVFFLIPPILLVTGGFSKSYNQLVEFAKEGKIIISCYPSNNEYYQAMSLFHPCYPSAGAMAMAVVRHLNSDFSWGNIYGASHKEILKGEKFDSNKYSYYNRVTSVSERSPHNYEHEARKLAEIIK